MRLLNFALNYLRIAVRISIRGGTNHLRIAARKTMLLFRRHLKQRFRPVAIPHKRASCGLRRRGVNVHCLSFNVLIRLEVSVGSTRLQRPHVNRTIAALRMTLECPSGVSGFRFNV
jgi:hypothetical protein